MCLYNLKNIVKSQYGYKWMESMADGTFATPWMGRPFFLNKWQFEDRDDSLFLESDYSIKYPSGFHIFKHKEHALVSHWSKSCDTLFKVEYSGLLAEGIEAEEHIILVVRGMKLVEELAV